MTTQGHYTVVFTDRRCCNWALTVFELPGYVASGLSFLTTLFVFVIGLLVAGVLVDFVMDVAQTKDAIRRNYPVIGPFVTRPGPRASSSEG